MRAGKLQPSKNRASLRTSKLTIVAKPWWSDECMIAPCEAAGILLVREGLILSSVRAEWITFPQQVFTSPHFPKAAASPRPGGSRPHCPRARPEGRCGLRSPAALRGPLPWGRHPCDQDPKPTCLCVFRYPHVHHQPGHEPGPEHGPAVAGRGALQPAGGVAAAAPGEPGRGAPAGPVPAGHQSAR